MSALWTLSSFSDHITSRDHDMSMSSICQAGCGVWPPNLSVLLSTAFTLKEELPMSATVTVLSFFVRVYRIWSPISGLMSMLTVSRCCAVSPGSTVTVFPPVTMLIVLSCSTARAEGEEGVWVKRKRKARFNCGSCSGAGCTDKLCILLPAPGLLGCNTSSTCNNDDVIAG